jgi:hypothetical protein
MRLSETIFSKVENARSLIASEKSAIANARDARATQNYPTSRLLISGSFFRRKRNQLFHVLRMLSRGVR